MRLTLDITKSIELNAAQYYELAKKLKRKFEHAKLVIVDVKKKIETLEKERTSIKEVKQKVVRKKEWYEKFHWFKTSKGLFVIGGRDATTNELVIKKYMEKNDLVFHTELSGSPFFLLKCEGNVDEQSIAETAKATACYSKAWKIGLGTVEVFYVKPEQVTKTAGTGEYIAKGSFMIRGKKEHKIITNFEIAVGKKEDSVIGGPLDAISSETKEYVIVHQGKERQVEIAKKIARKLNADVDDVIPFLPAGGLGIKK